MNCQRCDFQNEETAKFCKNCGAKLVVPTFPKQKDTVCQRCNFQNEGTAKFCRSCGVKLVVSTPPKQKNTICQECNFQNEEIAKFCKNCGAKMKGVTGNFHEERESLEKILTGF